MPAVESSRIQQSPEKVQEEVKSDGKEDEKAP